MLDRKNISDDRGGWGCGWWGGEAEGWPHTLGTIFQIPTVLEIQQNLGGDMEATGIFPVLLCRFHGGLDWIQERLNLAKVWHGTGNCKCSRSVHQGEVT